MDSSFKNSPESGSLFFHQACTGHPLSAPGTQRWMGRTLCLDSSQSSRPHGMRHHGGPWGFRAEGHWLLLGAPGRGALGAGPDSLVGAGGRQRGLSKGWESMWRGGWQWEVDLSWKVWKGKGIGREMMGGVVSDVTWSQIGQDSFECQARVFGTVFIGNEGSPTDSCLQHLMARNSIGMSVRWLGAQRREPLSCWGVEAEVWSSRHYPGGDI